MPQVAQVEDYDSDESHVKPGTRREARRRAPTTLRPPRAIDRYRSGPPRDGASDSGYSSLSSGSQRKIHYDPDGVTIQYSVAGGAPVVLPPPAAPYPEPTTTNPSKKSKPVIHRSSSQRSKDKPSESGSSSCADPNCQHATCSSFRSLQYQQAPPYPTQYQYQYAHLPPTSTMQAVPTLDYQPRPRSATASRPALPASFHAHSSSLSPYAGTGANQGPPPSVSAYQSNYYAAWVQAYRQQQQQRQQLQTQQALQQTPSYGAPPPLSTYTTTSANPATHHTRNSNPDIESAMQRRSYDGLQRTYSARPQTRPPKIPGAYPQVEVERHLDDSSESLWFEDSDDDHEIDHHNRARDSRYMLSSSDRRPSEKKYHPTAPLVPASSSSDILRRKPATETGLEYISSSENAGSDRKPPDVVVSARERPRGDHAPSRRRPSISTTASSGRTKATTVSSNSGLANVIVERNGRHVTYLSQKDREALEYARQQMDDRKLQDEVRANQDSMQIVVPLPELTTDNIRKHERHASSSEFSGRSRKDGSSSSPKDQGTDLQIGDNVIHVHPGSKIELRQGENGESVLVIGNASREENVHQIGTAREQSNQVQQNKFESDSDKVRKTTLEGYAQSEVDSESGVDIEPRVDVQHVVNVRTGVDIESGLDAEFEVDAEPADAMSVGSKVNTYAASSGVSMSQRTSSTQPTTAGTSKRGSASGDDKNVEHVATENDAHDAESIRTDNRQVAMLNETKMKLSRYFAAELFSGIQAARGSSRTISRESLSGLPELLRQFSLLAEQRVRSSLEQRAAAFVRHRRNEIAAYFQSKCSAVYEPEPQEKSGMADPNYVDRMDLLWRGDRTGTAYETAEIPLDQDLASIPDLDEDNDDEEGTSFPPDIEVAIDFLLAGEECQWLLNQVHIASQTMATGNTFMKVRRSLSEGLGDRRQLVFRVSWNPLAFVQQQYDTAESFDLGLVVCISGKTELAQATTCKEYVAMMWPNTGAIVVSKLNQLIGKSLNLTTGAEFDDHTSSVSQMAVSNDHLIVKATGSRIELLEIGEVLAWVGAACRTSESDRISYCVPRIACNGSISCSINYDFSEVDEKDVDPNGGSKCWLKIFNNPTVVKGYPIRSREQGEPGLEVPLNMAAVLGYAQFATSFNDQFLLKGPCSALLPTRRQGTTVIWHYMVNDDQEPLTYEQALGRQSDCPKMDLVCLEGSRHFVGWTPNVQILTGTKHAEYNNIDYGGAFIEKSGYALSEVVVGGGYKYFTIGGTFTPGKKDYHHFQGISGPYQLQIRLAGQYNVVLYDAADRRGWLVDGTSFVLHLARAALSHPSGHFAEDSADRLVAQFTHLDQDPDPNAGRMPTAREILLNRTNRQIAMFQDLELDESSQESGNASVWRFEDLVLHYCNILDKIRGHQIKLQQSHQWKVRNPLSTPKTLEGFGFLDILQMEPDIRPRAVKLTSSASHWLKVTEKAGAINILGSNFGDLFAPLQEECPHQLHVPCGVDFLAAPVGILQQIATKRCGMSEGSFQLADGIAWNKPSASFANTSCFCNNSYRKLSGRNVASKARECHVHVTELGMFKPLLHQTRPRDYKSINFNVRNGAVILGRESDLAKAIKLSKRPSTEASEDGKSQYEADKASHDSGIDVNSIGRSDTS